MNKLKNAGVSLIFTLFLLLAAAVMLGLVAVLMKLCIENGPVFGGVVVFLAVWAAIHRDLKEDGVLK